jgi:hypothetical protein
LVITSGLPGSVLHFASSVDAKDKVGEDTRAVEVLMRSSGDSWLTTSTQVQPDLQAYPAGGFPPPADDRRSHPMAVTVVGGFTSGVKQGQPGQGR